MELTDEHVELIRRIRDGRVLPLADRRQDRIRQKCRKAGLIQCVSSPRRWVVTQMGLHVLALLDRRSAA